MSRRLAALTVVAFLALPILPALGDGAGSPAECETPYSAPGGSYTAPVGWTITGVCVKAGQLHTGLLGNGLHGCYLVGGVGSNAVTVTKTASGPGCQDISHIDVAKTRTTTTTEVPPSSTTTIPASTSTSSTLPTPPSSTTTTIPWHTTTTTTASTSSTSTTILVTTSTAPIVTSTTVATSSTSIVPPVVVDTWPEVQTIPSTLPSELPHTGISAVWVAVGGIVLAALGGLVVALTGKTVDYD